MGNVTSEVRWLRNAEVCERYGVTRSTLIRWVKAGKFPASRRIHVGTVRWSVEELEQYDQEILNSEDSKCGE